MARERMLQKDITINLQPMQKLSLALVKYEELKYGEIMQ